MTHLTPCRAAPQLFFALLAATALAACGGGSATPGPSSNITASISAAGSNAAPMLLRTTAEPAGTACPAGGRRIDSGLDANANGLLDSSEITSTVFVCDGAAGSAAVPGAVGSIGAPGSAGAVGAAGTAGAGGAAGVAGATGANGAAGTVGTAGLVGAAGTTGAAGPTGAMTIGAQGPAGAQGAPGIAGINGINGANGSNSSVNGSVPSINQPPVARSALSINGLLLKVDAFGSSDADGIIASYQWDFGEPSSGAANTATSVNASHTYATDGIYTVTLIVTDNLGAPSVNQGTITAVRYIKISSTGAPLPASATAWDCVRDLTTGLIWEVKTADGGLRDTNKNYSNYLDRVFYTAAQINNGNNSIGFKNAVNAAGLCGASDWRLPTGGELQGIIDTRVARPNPMIESSWFPNTAAYYYWSADPGVFPERAYRADFGGLSRGIEAPRYINYPVRLVR